MTSTFTNFSRSRGLKLFIICALVLLMAIPAIFVSLISFDRADRAKEVNKEVSQRYGGAQYVTGPFLAVPYTVTNADGKIGESGEYIIFPETGSAQFDNVDIEVRKRSLFKVPVFQAQGVLTATFTEIDKDILSASRNMEWEKARLLIGISDSRGLRNEVYAVVGPGSKGRIKLQPAMSKLTQRVVPVSRDVKSSYTFHSGYIERNGGSFLSAPAADLINSLEGFNVKVDLSLGGAGNLGVYPFAKTTDVHISSDWASPGFQGGFAPTTREINSDGFSASWKVPYLARGVLGQGPAQTLQGFNSNKNAMAVQFVAQVNPYQTVNRALKYAVFFIGLVFMVFFLFEIILGQRVHPAQYILIGLAQTVFYLLLLAFSEHMGFDLSYLIAAAATVALTALYGGAVFGGRQYALQAALVFSLTYGLLYVLMRRSDYALLLGALTAFFTIAATMYLTRNMDWYGGRAEEEPKLRH